MSSAHSLSQHFHLRDWLNLASNVKVLWRQLCEGVLPGLSALVYKFCLLVHMSLLLFLSVSFLFVFSSLSLF